MRWGYPRPSPSSAPPARSSRWAPLCFPHPVPFRWSMPGVETSPRTRRALMADPFEYVSKSKLEYRYGYRHAYLGDVPAPVVYGVQGALREYYGVAEGPPVASTLDHIVAAVAG